MTDYHAAKDEWLSTLAADTSLPARQKSTAFLVGWYLTTLTNRKLFDEESVLEAWPGLSTISGAIKTKKGTVISALRALEHAGYISVLQGAAGRGNSSRYRLLKKGPATAPFNGEDEKVPWEHEKVLWGKKRCRVGNGKGADTAPETLNLNLERNLDQSLEDDDAFARSARKASGPGESLNGKSRPSSPIPPHLKHLVDQKTWIRLERLGEKGVTLVQAAKNADNPKAYLIACITNAEQEGHNGHAGSEKPRPLYQLSFYCNQCGAHLHTSKGKHDTRDMFAYEPCEECGHEHEGGKDRNTCICDGEWNEDQPPPRKPPHDDSVPF
jgi:hypothetical protein